MTRGKETPKYESVLGTIGFESGRHYWEIKMDEYGNEADIFVGVAKRDADNNRLNCTSTPHEQGWGWVATGNMLHIGSKLQRILFGGYSKIGSVVGILLEFVNGEGQLTFYRDGENLGTPIKNIPAGCYYPCVSLFDATYCNV